MPHYFPASNKMVNFTTTAVAILLYRIEEEEAEETEWVQMTLNAVGRRRRDRRYPRVSLRRYADSPFRHLHDSNNDQALLNATGVDHAEFRNLLAAFKPIFYMYTIDESTGYEYCDKLILRNRKVRKRRTSSLRWN